MKNTNLPTEAYQAVVWFGSEVAIARFAERNLDGLPNIEIKHFNPEAAELDKFGVGVTAPTNFNFRTRQLYLDKNILDENDVDVAAYLINAVNTNQSLGDGNPVLNSPLEETVAQMVRLPNETVALTQMPRSELDAVKLRMESLSAGSDQPAAVQISEWQIQAETPLRAAVRAFLCEERRAAADNTVTAFVLANETGFAIGLWNSDWGLFYERAEPLPEEFSFEESLDFTEFETLEEDFQPEYKTEYTNDYDAGSHQSFQSKSNGEEELRSGVLGDFLRHAVETAIQTARETAEEMAFDGVEKIVISVPLANLKIVSKVAAELMEEEAILIEVLGEPLEHKIVRGLLYAFIRNNPLPQVDLCRDLYARLVDHSLEIERTRHAAQIKLRTQAALAVLIPVFLFIGFIGGTLAHYARSSAMLAVRSAAADSEGKRLEPILNDRASYVENFTWRDAYLRQILNLRDRQTVAISFLPEVDRRYAGTGDPRFAFTDLKLGSAGDWEMRGIASSEEAVTNFVRGLEFAETPNAKGVAYRTFANLTPAFGKGLNDKLPTGAVSPYKGSGTIPVGWFGWEIKGIYTPLQKLAPAAPAAPGQTNQPAANQPPPAAAPPVKP